MTTPEIPDDDFLPGGHFSAEVYHKMASRGNPHGYGPGFTIEKHRDDLVARLGEAIKRINAAELRIRELEQALQGIMQLIEHGVLVRDTSRDVETGWALHQLPLLCALQKAQASLHVADKAVKNG